MEKGTPWKRGGEEGYRDTPRFTNLPNLRKREPELGGQLEKPPNVTSGGADRVGVRGRVFPPLMQCPHLPYLFSWLKSWTSDNQRSLVHSGTLFKRNKYVFTL